MIEFKCPHCGKALHLRDEYAGRDGWCRVCRKMVIVPGSGEVARVEDLPPEIGYPRLQRLLQYAAGKAEDARALRLEYDREKRRLEDIEAEMKHARDALAAEVRRAETVRAQLDALQRDRDALQRDRDDAVARAKDLESALRERSENLASGDSGAETLQRELDRERQAREQAEARLAEMDRRIGDQDAAIQRLESFENEARLKRVELESALDASRAALELADADRARLLREIADLEAAAGEQADQLRQEVAALEVALAGARAALSDDEQAQRKRVADRDATIAMLRAELEETRAAAAADRESRSGYAADLEAEIMNLNEVLAGRGTDDREAEALRKRIADQNAELDQLRARVSELELQATDWADALESGGAEVDVILLDPDSPPAFQAAPEAPAPGAPTAADPRRAREQKDMMEALSDFLNK